MTTRRPHGRNRRVPGSRPNNDVDGRAVERRLAQLLAPAGSMDIGDYGDPH
jgi:hypothetical protein